MIKARNYCEDCDEKVELKVGVIHEWICLEFWIHLMATSFQGLLNAFRKKWLLVVGCMTIFERGISYWLWTLRVDIITQGCQRFSNCKKMTRIYLWDIFFEWGIVKKCLCPEIDCQLIFYWRVFLCVVDFLHKLHKNRQNYKSW